MALIDKATTMEQSRNMYSLNSGLTYWMEWAEAFIKQCEDLGWEVAVGPGTSLGAVMLGATVISDGSGEHQYSSVPVQSCGWDCDWTQKDGIYSRWQSESDKYNNYPKYTGWFKGFEAWPSGANEKGIDKSTGRFDFIVYTGEGNSGEKIGFRIKYPVCSVGYSYHSSNHGLVGSGNYIYASPMISLYSSYKRDISNYYPTNPSETYYSAQSNAKSYASKFEGYVYLFGKRPYRSPSVFYDSSFWGKTDKNNTYYVNLTYGPSDIVESPLWSLELQSNDNFSINTLYTNTSVQTIRLFKYNWYKYNKFHYHVSQTGDTVYMYVSDDSGNIGFKLITTTLESGEKAIMMERRNPVEDGILCEMAAVTGSPTNNPSQPEDDYLIRLPKRPYVKHNSGTGKFSLSRMLIPTQLSLCKDLYYVTKRDINKSIGNGQYVWIKDKKSEKHCFRIIPFGSTSIQETLGDNTTYLAFPVKDPPEQEEEV